MRRRSILVLMTLLLSVSVTVAVGRWSDREHHASPTEPSGPSVLSSKQVRAAMLQAEDMGPDFSAIAEEPGSADGNVMGGDNCLDDMLKQQPGYGSIRSEGLVMTPRRRATVPRISTRITTFRSDDQAREYLSTVMGMGHWCSKVEDSADQATSRVTVDVVRAKVPVMRADEQIMVSADGAVSGVFTDPGSARRFRAHSLFFFRMHLVRISNNVVFVMFVSVGRMTAAPAAIVRAAAERLTAVTRGRPIPDLEPLGVQPASRADLLDGGSLISLPGLSS